MLQTQGPGGTECSPCRGTVEVDGGFGLAWRGEVNGFGVVDMRGAGVEEGELA